jgi:hypothetical protein
MSRFTKKISGIFSKAGDKVSDGLDTVTDKASDTLNSEAIPTVKKGAGIGVLASGAGVGAVMLGVGALTAPVIIGLPIMAAGAIVGAVSGGFLHKKKHKKDPKPPAQ